MLFWIAVAVAIFCWGGNRPSKRVSLVPPPRPEDFLPNPLSAKIPKDNPF